MPPTTKTITRYSSRKLYDSGESRYVSLEELAEWIRDDREIQVIDKKTGDDVTAQTLTQIILEQGRNGNQLPPGLLHELVRRGEQVWASGLEQVQTGVDRLMHASLEKVAPVRRAREEMEDLRQRLSELEDSIRSIEEPKTGRNEKRTSKASGGASRSRKASGSQN